MNLKNVAILPLIALLACLVTSCRTPRERTYQRGRHQPVVFNVATWPTSSSSRTHIGVRGHGGLHPSPVPTNSPGTLTWSVDFPLADLTTFPVDTYAVYGENLWWAAIERTEATRTNEAAAIIEFFFESPFLLDEGAAFDPITPSFAMHMTDAMILEMIPKFVDLSKTNSLGQFDNTARTNDLIWVFEGDTLVGGDLTDIRWRLVPRWFHFNFSGEAAAGAKYGWPVGPIRGNEVRAPLHGNLTGDGNFWRSLGKAAYLPHYTATNLIESCGAGTTLVRRIVIKHKAAFSNDFSQLAGVAVREDPIEIEVPTYVNTNLYDQTQITTNFQVDIFTNHMAYPGLITTEPETVKVVFAEFEYTPLREESLKPAGFTKTFWWDELNAEGVLTTVITNYSWLANMTGTFEVVTNEMTSYYAMTNTAETVYCIPLLEVRSVATAAETNKYRWGFFEIPTQLIARTWFLIDDLDRGLVISTNSYESLGVFAVIEKLPYKYKDLDYGWKSIFLAKPSSEFYSPPIMPNGPSGYYTRGGVIRPTKYTVAVVARDQLRFYANFRFYSRSGSGGSFSPNLRELAGGTYPDKPLPLHEWWQIQNDINFDTVNRGTKDAAPYPIDYMTWDTITNWPKAVMTVTPRYENVTNLPPVDLQFGVRPTYMDEDGHLRMAFFPMGILGSYETPWHKLDVIEFITPLGLSVERRLGVERSVLATEFAYDLTTNVTVTIDRPIVTNLDVAITDVVLDDRDHADTNVRPAWIVNPITNVAFGARHNEIIDPTPYGLRGGIVGTTMV